jgi:hypothetical protein
MYLSQNVKYLYLNLNVLFRIDFKFILNIS